MTPAGIHDVAATGFEAGAEDYERGRPAYPSEAIDYLARVLRLGPASVVLDLAAGTGKLTRQLVGVGARVVAVEPVAGMRRKLEESLPGVTVLDGTAEAIPLPDDSVDAVTVGQAFHWFDPAAALVEIHRVLRPAGGLGLVWNLRDESVGWVARLSEIIDRARRDDLPTAYGGDWRAAFADTALFTPLEERRFRFEQEMDGELLVARVASISFVASLPDAERKEVLAEVRELVEGDPELAGAERFVLPYETLVYSCRRRP